MQNFQPVRFQILPPVVKNLLIINAIFFVATLVLGNTLGINLSHIFGLHYITSDLFKPWQIITYMFMHSSDNFGHIFFNMFALWMFGSAIENAWGGKRFLFYFLITGIGAAVCHYLVITYQMHYVWNPLLPHGTFINHLNIVGASGAVFGILLAFGMLFPNSMIYLYSFIPVKAKWVVITYGAVELIYGVAGSNDGIAHFAHLGGMLFGLILILLWKKKGNIHRFN